MPVWNAKTKDLVKQGKLVILAIAQEHHPERPRLFAQWHNIDWIILHDPINVMQVPAVPIEIAIDEKGIVRSTKIKPETIEKDFLDKTYDFDDMPLPTPIKPSIPDLDALRKQAESSGSSIDWRKLGDALVFWAPDKIDRAIEAYKKTIEINPEDPDAHFRLGVCCRMRYESSAPQPGDFKTAVDYWTKARALNPNQYIWRRRLEQYGPRSTKPYPFYNWTQTAAEEIKSRGDSPIELKILPTGSELAAPARDFEIDTTDIKEPDPDSRIFRDKKSLIRSEVTIIPPVIEPGKTARIHITLRPDKKQKAHWNNQAPPLKIWIDPPEGFKTNAHLLAAPQPAEPESAEPRTLEFELLAPPQAKGTISFNAYALYYVCEDKGGVCYYLRNDIPITLQIR